MDGLEARAERCRDRLKGPALVVEVPCLRHQVIGILARRAVLSHCLAPQVAFDELDHFCAFVRVDADRNTASATRWVDGGFARLG